MPLELPRRVVHVWCVRPEAVPIHLLDRYILLLSASERERYQRFRFEWDRRHYLISWTLVRTVLSRYHDIEPGAWRFWRNRYGKPELTPGPGIPCLHFNLSHTLGLAACAVTSLSAVGVDVERLDRPILDMELVSRYFAPAEVKSLAALPPAERPAALFTLWTLKEAYVKATGIGLSLPLESFAFTLKQPPTITFSAQIEDDAQQWQFACRQPTPRHVLGLAVRRTAPDLPIVFQETIPLVEVC